MATLSHFLTLNYYKGIVRKGYNMSVKIDLTGKRFGSLTVLKLAEDIPGKKKKWL